MADRRRRKRGNSIRPSKVMLVDGSGSEKSGRRVGKGASMTRRLLSASRKQSRPAPISVGEGVARGIASREPLAEEREIYRPRVGRDMEARQED